MQGDSRLAAAGVATGTATLFDDHGPIGTAIVTALANPAAQIDFGDSARTAGASPTVTPTRCTAVLRQPDRLCEAAIRSMKSSPR